MSSSNKTLASMMKRQLHPTPPYTTDIYALIESFVAWFDVIDMTEFKDRAASLISVFPKNTDQRLLRKLRDETIGFVAESREHNKTDLWPLFVDKVMSKFTNGFTAAIGGHRHARRAILYDGSIAMRPEEDFQTFIRRFEATWDAYEELADDELTDPDTGETVFPAASNHEKTTVFQSLLPPPLRLEVAKKVAIDEVTYSKLVDTCRACLARVARIQSALPGAHSALSLAMGGYPMMAVSGVPMAPQVSSHLKGAALTGKPDAQLQVTHKVWGMPTVPSYGINPYLGQQGYPGFSLPPPKATDEKKDKMIADLQSQIAKLKKSRKVGFRVEGAPTSQETTSSSVDKQGGAMLLSRAECDTDSGVTVPLRVQMDPTRALPEHMGYYQTLSSLASLGLTPECYVCGSTKHLARFCPTCARCGGNHNVSACNIKWSDVKCETCGRTGHKSSVCYQHKLKGRDNRTPRKNMSNPREERILRTLECVTTDMRDQQHTLNSVMHAVSDATSLVRKTQRQIESERQRINSLANKFNSMDARGQPPNPRKRPNCRHWLKGSCRHGDTCRFSHPEALRGSKRRPPANPPANPAAQPKQGSESHAKQMLAALQSQIDELKKSHKGGFPTASVPADQHAPPPGDDQE